MKYDKDGVIISDSLNGLGQIFIKSICLMPCVWVEHVIRVQWKSIRVT